MSDQTNAITRAKSAVALALLILGDACVETAQGEAPLDDSAMLPPKVGPDENKSILRSPTTKQEPEFRCVFCGAPSYVDPSDQTPPPDYCHESDHGEPDLVAEIKQLRLENAAMKAEWEKAYEIGILAKQQLAAAQASKSELLEALEYLLTFNHKTYRVGGVENWREYPSGEALLKAIEKAEKAIATHKAREGQS